MTDSSSPISRAPNSLPPTVPTSSVITRLERELRDLWAPPLKSTAPAATPTARSCTMNLVVVAGSKALADRYVSVVDEVAAGIPCRAILVALDADSVESSLDGDVTKVCPPNEAYLCSERVRLVATGQVVDRVGSAVEALCVPEIPTALVWLGRVHVDDPVFLSLSRDVQRVILDTDHTSLTSLVALAKLARGEHAKRPGAAFDLQGAEVADLAWTRLATWQELCARFFDSPALVGAVEGVTELSVTQASNSGSRLGSEAALLVAWLATRLGWTSSRVGGQLRFKRRDGGDVRVKLANVPRPEAVAPAALASVSLTAEKDGVVLKGSIERDLASGPAEPAAVGSATTRDADMLHWRLDVQGRAPLAQDVRLGANKGAKLLERTLHRPACDEVLLESIAFAERVFDDAAITN